MPRARNGVAKRLRRKRLLKQAEGFWGNRKSRFRKAKETLLKAGVYAYRDRKTRKRQFRYLWIVRLNAAARQIPQIVIPPMAKQHSILIVKNNSEGAKFKHAASHAF